MTPPEIEEYKALRATIRERGTARICTFVLGMMGWAAFLTASAALSLPPLWALLPLLVLAAVFEAVFAFHIGVERIGRYIQVFLETDGGWETTAMAYGRSFQGGGSDPLFTVAFLAALMVNFLQVLVAEPVPVELAVSGAAHLCVVARILAARRESSRQRGTDLERFQRLKAFSGPGQS